MVSLTTLFCLKRRENVPLSVVSQGGSDWNEYFVKNVETGELMDDHLQWIKFSGAAWFRNGFFYGRFAEPSEGKELSSQNENKQIYYHELGTDQSEDKLVYEDPANPRRGTYAVTTEDERYLLLYLSNGATSDNALKVKDLAVADSRFVDVVSTFDHSYDVVDNIDNMLLVVTNDGAPRRRLIGIDMSKPGKSNWKELIPEQAEVLNSVNLVGGKIFANYLKDASTHIYIHNLDGTRTGEVELPGIGTASGMIGKKDDNVAFYTFTSFIYPSTVFKYDVNTDKSEEFRKSGVDFDPSKFETKQVFFPSKDGTKIPSSRI